MGLPWIALSYYGLTLASALFPWVNAELIALSLPAVAPSKPSLFFLVLVVTAGQMSGKCLLYWASRKGNRILPERASIALLKWRARLEARPRQATALVFISAIFGLPPFYLMTLLAGALRMNFLKFAAAGTAGRLVHFGAIVTLPGLAMSMF
jgi:membrane protein YqaA with SNARE-associated domain